MFELNDSRIIQRHNDLAVMAQRFEVMFRDGTSVRLHPVAVQGHEQPLLRALQLQGDHWAVIDLRHFGPELEADLRRLQPRDAPGVVFYTLRLQYPTAGAFVAAVHANALVIWGPSGQRVAANVAEAA